LLRLAEGGTPLLVGHDGKIGWLSSSLGKTKLYDHAAEVFRNGETTLHSFETYLQLASIEGGTLRAPEGQKDDRADGYSLGLMARKLAPAGTSRGIVPHVYVTQGQRW